MSGIGHGLFSFAALAFRRDLGRDFTGIRVLMRIAFALVVLLLVGVTLRGFFHGSALGGFLDVPMVLPSVVALLASAMLWCLRASGGLTAIGPLRDQSEAKEFTGHAAGLWGERVKIAKEWTILGTLEPCVLCVAGLVLLLLPFTRYIGLILILAAISVWIQTKSDVSANRATDKRSERHYDGVVRVESPRVVPQVTRRIGQIMYDLDDDLLDLLDPEVAAELRQVEQYAEEVTALVPVEPEPADGDAITVPAFERRGEKSAKPFPIATIPLLLLMLLVGGYVAIGDPLRLGDVFPDRAAHVAASWRSSLGSVGLADDAERLIDSDGLAALIGHISPDAASSLNNLRAERALQQATEAASSARAVIHDARTRAKSLLGCTTSLIESSVQLDTLILTSPSAADMWAELLSINETLTQALANADVILSGSALEQPAEFIEVRNAASGWERSALRLVDLATRLRDMMEARRINRSYSGKE